MSDLAKISAQLHSVKELCIGLSRAFRDSKQQQRRPPDMGSRVIRAMAAEARAVAFQQDLQTYVFNVYPEAQAERILETRRDPAGAMKAATNPAMTTVAGWASELVSIATVAPPVVLAPTAALSQIAVRPAVLAIDLAAGIIRLPGLTPGDFAGGFVGENEPIPVAKGAISGATITPHKAAVISTYSRELAKSSSFEMILRAGINADLGQTIDKAFLGSGAATAAQPAGLLFGVAPLAASTETGAAGVGEDLSALASAIPASADLIFISRPETRFRAQLFAPGALAGNWIDSAAVAANQIIAVDVASLAVGFDGFEFSVVESAVEVLEDGTVPAFATQQTYSSWQMALIGMRCLCDVTWGLRAAGRVAHIDAIAW